MAELQVAQQRRRRNTRIIPALVVLVAVVVALTLVTGLNSGGSKKKVKTATGPTTTVAGTPAGLIARTGPSRSPNCDAPTTPSASTTTVAASGNAVSVVPAPDGVAFPKLDGSSPRYTAFSAVPPFCIDTTKTYTAVMKTDAGDVTIHLLAANAPLTVNNFVFLAGYHFFDGIVFHRVIPGFVDQGGDPTGTGSGGPGYKFADEVPSSNSAYDAGALAMANSGANTNGSQFFFVVPGGGSQLTPAYSVFGQVTSGLDVVQKINADGSQSGTPAKVHKIVSVSITES